MRRFASFVTAALLGIAVIAMPSSAQAANVAWAYNAATGATFIKALGGVVQSDLTAQSGVSGGGFSRAAANSTVGGKVGQLLTVGAAETRTTADYDAATGTKLTSWARTAGVNLLNGLIKVDAIETKSETLARPNGTVTHTGNSTLAGIKIVGVKLPVTIPKNYSVTVPGVAIISLNYDMSGSDANGAIALNWAIAVQLLKPQDNFDIGTTIIVNPVNQALLKVEADTGALLGGSAYATRIAANVGSDIKVVSDPTAQVGVPFASSGGKTLRNATASVTVPGVLNLGAVASTSTSNKDGRDAEITNTNEIAGLNLLGGLVKADAIKVTAHGKRVGSTWTGDLSMSLVNLVIAGKTIPINVAPNTTINVANLGKVEINKQVTNRAINANQIHAVRITLNTAQAGLPVGAVIEIGSASTIIY